MRIANAEHTSLPLRIHEIVPDFTLEDVWALPVYGGADDFPDLVETMASFDPTKADSLAARVLWDIRDRLGRWFDLGAISAEGRQIDAADGLSIPGTDETSLIGRLPVDLRGTTDDLGFDDLPFTPVFRTNNEFAAEVSNKTVHGVLHLAWVDQGGGRHQGQMAVYVKPRGAFGHAYMAFIKPFRYLVVYPALMRQMEKAWTSRSDVTDEFQRSPSSKP